MNPITENLQHQLNELARARDELKLQVTLGRAELRDQWERLEEHWMQLQAKAKLVEDASTQTMTDLGDLTNLLASELRDGYQRIRDALKVDMGPTTKQLQDRR